MGGAGQPPQRPLRRRHAFHGCLGVGSLLVVALVSFGCTTLQSTQLPPEELRYGIRSGDLVQPGDEISVVTVDGAELVLVARDVDDAVIRGELPGGEEATVAIDDLVALRTHQVDPVRTGFAVAGGSYALTLLLWVFIGFTIVFGAA